MADDKQAPAQDEEEELVPSPGRPRYGKVPRKKAARRKKVAKKSAPTRQKKKPKKKSRAR
ncbi:MAG: hypothetical protein IPM35_33380 [Myxococcales bacterium]|nr:hypothetical protein [Myxococcales bacterium]